VEDYPRDLAEFERRFATEAACRTYLVQLRWPEGVRCARCRGVTVWPVRQVLFECSGCGHQTSVTAGTIFQDTRMPLRTWFRAIWWVTNQKTGVSALGLQRALGLRSYKTAWAWLHKLRRAMVRPGRDRLTGWVEVDETFVGGVHPGRRGRQTQTKALVGIAVQIEGRRLGRIRLQRLPDASGPSLLQFVQDAIEPGSHVHTDGWVGYHPLRRHGYKHRITFLEGQSKTASQLMPHVHQVSSLLKRWLLGTHHGRHA
jgi:transposase-like protein